LRVSRVVEWDESSAAMIRANDSDNGMAEFRGKGNYVVESAGCALGVLLDGVFSTRSAFGKSLAALSVSEKKT
jgi:hypothetical protein